MLSGQQENSHLTLRAFCFLMDGKERTRHSFENLKQGKRHWSHASVEITLFQFFLWNFVGETCATKEQATFGGSLV